MSPPPNVGLWEFNIMPFGLTDAPATFQRLIDVVLMGMTWQGCLAYLDDICLAHGDLDDHYNATVELFERLEAAGLTLKAKKCSILQRELKYLGHTVSADGIKVDPKYTQAIQQIQKPTTKRMVQQFLGLTNYYRKFIPAFSHIAKPLYKMTEKEPPTWGPQQDRAFQLLKDALLNPPILAYPDYTSDPEDAPFVLYTDASNVGIAGILSQKQQGQERIISCVSRALNKAERNYAAAQREMLAVVWSINKLRHYLYGRPFTVVTDNSALTYLEKLKDPVGRLARWAMSLQEYRYEVVHRKGALHHNADVLSRLMYEEPTNKKPAIYNKDVHAQTNYDINAFESELDGIDETIKPDSKNFETFISKMDEEQRSDPWVSCIIRSLAGNATDEDRKILKGTDLSLYEMQGTLLSRWVSPFN
jgi:hypothetical protein